MPRPRHFEIHAGDHARARAWWLISTGEGIGINGVIPRRGPDPAVDAQVVGVPVTVDCADGTQTVADVTAAGGTVVVPTGPVPGIGWRAHVKDTEGNILGVMQIDPEAG